MWLLATAHLAGAEGALRRRREPAASPPRATLLVVGDSLVGGPFAFARALRDRLRERRVRVVEDTWVGVGVQRFASSKRFRELLATHRPTHVLVVLGTNDYALPAPEAVAPAVQRIASRAAAAVEAPSGSGSEGAEAARCAWVGPLVAKDTGIVRVIEEHAAPCSFIDSRRFGVPTIRDGFHPSMPGARLWADGVLDELAAQGWTWTLP